MNSINILRRISIMVSTTLVSGLVSFAALAEDAAPAAGKPMGGLLSQAPIFIVIIALMYFLMIRPQNKRAKEHRDLVSKIAKGDEVLTSGGIMGVVEKVSDGLVVVRVSDGVNITFQKQAIAASLPKGTMKSI